MLCPLCGQENREGASFCGECAAPLVESITCAGCGTSNPITRKFCDSCGQSLAQSQEYVATPDPRSYTPDHLAEKILAARSAVEGERKQVTVLFADVKGHMDLAERI